MEANVVECDPAEREHDVCVCKRGPTLSILKDVQRVYEERLALVERVGGNNKLQMQTDVLRSWVGDLVGQNTLLARAVEELEVEATTRLLYERRKHSEIVCEMRAEAAALRRRLTRKQSDVRGLLEVLRRLRELDSCRLDGIHFFERDRRKKCGSVNELKILNDTLQKENTAKDREIRKLNRDVQQYEQTIINLRNQMSLCDNYDPTVTKKDAEVMAGMCCTGNECGDWEPVKECSAELCEETLKYQERIHKMETSLKATSDSVRTLRKVNVGLSDELHELRRVCAALNEHCRAANTRMQFKDDIIREMRRQLNQAKTKLKELQDSKREQDYATSELEVPRSYDTVTIACVRQQPRRARDDSAVETRRFSDGGRHAALDGSGDDVDMFSSFESCLAASADTATACDNTNGNLDETLDVCVIEHPDPEPILVSDASVEDLQRSLPPARPSPAPLPSSPQGHRRKQVRLLKKAGSNVEELYFNPGLRSEASVDTKSESKPASPCSNVQCESLGASSSLAETGSCTWDASARAQYYHNKLLSTLQVLQNKEETVRIQSESLRVAEARIAKLTARAEQLRNDLEAKANEVRALRRLERSKADRADAAVTAEAEEVENQKNIVSTLQTNLSVIEELYRECFYETAKQEELIEMLRKSCLDVRLMDKQKCSQIGRLQNVISSQRWSLQQCQDIAVEVESLKQEISNFLSNSSNDSGMWERSEDLPAELGSELRHIEDQLLLLRTILTGDCTCGLEEENMKLKHVNESMQIQLGDMRQRVSELETSLAEKELRDQQTAKQEKEKEVDIKRQLSTLSEDVREKTTTCETLARQLQQAQVSIEGQTRELVEARKQSKKHESTVFHLQQELERANRFIEESRGVQEEMSQLKAQLSASTRRAQALAAELERARERCCDLEHCYREKCQCAGALQEQLEEAHARGAALCTEVRRVVAAVQAWLRRARRDQRERDEKIKEQEDIINALQQAIEADKTEEEIIKTETPQCCTKCARRRQALKFTNEVAGCSKCADAEQRRGDGSRTSGSEMASCSTAPTPPKRLLKKKSSPCDIRYLQGWLGWGVRREVGVSQPRRRDAACCPDAAAAVTPPRSLSPASELEQRVSALQLALEHSQARWSHAHTR